MLYLKNETTISQKYENPKSKSAFLVFFFFFFFGLRYVNVWCLLLTCGVLECNKGDIIKLCVHHQTQFKKERTYLQGFYFSS